MNTKALRTSLRKREIESGDLEDEKVALETLICLANEDGLGWNIDYDAVELPCYSVTLTVYSEGWLEESSENLAAAIRNVMEAYFKDDELNRMEHHYPDLKPD